MSRIEDCIASEVDEARYTLVVRTGVDPKLPLERRILGGHFHAVETRGLPNPQVTAVDEYLSQWQIGEGLEPSPPSR